MLNKHLATACVEGKPDFEIDLRVEGVPDDVILKDEERMEEINEKLEKLEICLCAKSIREPGERKW